MYEPETDASSNGPSTDINGDLNYTSYAVSSLVHAIQLFLAEDKFIHAINESELAILKKFVSLSDLAKSLIVRLFGRVPVLFRLQDLRKLMGCDIDDLLIELSPLRILSEDMTCLKIETILYEMNRRELEQLASLYNVKDLKKLKMVSLVDTLLKISSTSPLSCFFSSSNTGGALKMRNIIARVLGKCWCLDKSRMRIFSWVLWLVSLGSDSDFGGPNRHRSVDALLKTHLYNMFIVRRGDIHYAPYEICRKSIIYRTSEELSRYLNLVDCRLRLEYLTDKKELTAASQLFESVKNSHMALLNDVSQRRTDLPVFLRRFTAPYQALKMLTSGVDLLERQKRYEEATDLIRLLLSIPQTNGSSAHRLSCPLDDIGPCRIGKLITRFLVDEVSHLKRFVSAYEFVHSFFGNWSDCSTVCPCLRAGKRLSVEDQLAKFLSTEHVNNRARDTVPDRCKGPRTIKRRRKNEIGHSTLVNDNTDDSSICKCSYLPLPSLIPSLLHAPKVELSASVSASSKDFGSHRPYYTWTEDRTVKTTDSSEEVNSGTTGVESQTLLLNVEQWTLRYYITKLGYKRGLHSESRVFHLIFVLVFYDIIFDTSFPDAFYSFRQSAPLDLFTDDFYQSRKALIDVRLQWISRLSSSAQTDLEAVKKLITNCWQLHYGERCLWVDWDLFSDAEEVIDLFWCLGPSTIHVFCNLLSTDYRSWNSGLPDLVVWNAQEHRAKIVEVKGPGDQLSTQQIMWLDAFMRVNADVEVCHVTSMPLKSLHGSIKQQ